MSRIGRLPVPVPEKVQVSIDGAEVTIKGPKGALTRRFDTRMEISFEDEDRKSTRLNSSHYS